MKFVLILFFYKDGFGPLMQQVGLCVEEEGLCVEGMVILPCCWHGEWQRSLLLKSTELTFLFLLPWKLLQGNFNLNILFIKTYSCLAKLVQTQYYSLNLYKCVY